MSLSKILKVCLNKFLQRRRNPNWRPNFLGGLGLNGFGQAAERSSHDSQDKCCMLLIEVLKPRQELLKVSLTHHLPGSSHNIGFLPPNYPAGCILKNRPKRFSHPLPALRRTDGSQFSD